MAITKDAGRQNPLVAKVTIAFDDYTTAVAAEAFDMPDNAIVIGGHVMVNTAWDSATSAVLDLGDGADDDRYTASAINVKTAGRTALTLTGYKYTASDTIDAIITHVGAPTVGTLDVVLEYIIDGRATENESRT